MKFSKALWTIGSLFGAQQVVRLARGLEFNDLLAMIGVQRRRSAVQMLLPTIGLVSLGAAVGAGTALLVAPSSGAELRQRLSEGADKLAEKMREDAPKLMHQSHA
jgi:hypothetical protein